MMCRSAIGANYVSLECVSQSQCHGRLLYLAVLSTMMLPANSEAATRFLNFVNASPTPFHAVQNASVRLEKAGFLKVLLV